jgi:hypothetical protein
MLMHARLLCGAMRRKHGNNQDMDDDDDDDDEMCVTESGSTAVTCFVRLPGIPAYSDAHARNWHNGGGAGGKARRWCRGIDAGMLCCSMSVPACGCADQGQHHLLRQCGRLAWGLVQGRQGHKPVG